MGIADMMGTGGMPSMGGGCEHDWRIFNDPKLKNSGHLSFFCTKCLALAKIKKEYPKEE